MKTRNDFVSNSSSCSFVVACQKDYLKDIAKDLAKACTNKKSMYHDKGLAKKNNLVLDFCLSTFQLAFLGKLLVETKEEKWSLEYFNEIWGKHIGNANAIDNPGLAEWNRYKKHLEDIKSGKDISPWYKENYEDDVYDQTTDTAIHYEKVYAQDIVVSNNVMESTFDRYHFNNSPDSSDVIDRRVEALIACAKEKIDRDYSGKRENFIEKIDIYQITKDTIDNTRDLISRGHKVVLEDWQDLDMLDAKIANRDAIFYVRIAHSGDGYGNFYIYCEDEANGLDAVSGIEILTSESL